jgi:hypothetical protein
VQRCRAARGAGRVVHGVLVAACPASSRITPARVLKPSLASTLETCSSTVLSVTCSVAAIWAFVCPSATSCATSRSRRVNPSSRPAPSRRPRAAGTAAGRGRSPRRRSTLSASSR